MAVASAEGGSDVTGVAEVSNCGSVATRLTVASARGSAFTGLAVASAWVSVWAGGLRLRLALWLGCPLPIPGLSLPRSRGRTQKPDVLRSLASSKDRVVLGGD